MSEAIPYAREVIDARFEALRVEVRADIAEQIGTVRREVAELSGQIRVWVLGLGLLMPLITLVISKVWK